MGLKVRDAPAFRESLRDRTFFPGEIHTFGFWGPSRAVDLTRWEFAGIPGFNGVNVDMGNGPPPLLLWIHQLLPAPSGEDRHLKSRQGIVMHVAGWSSIYWPTPDRLRKLG